MGQDKVPSILRGISSLNFKCLNVMQYSCRKQRRNYWCNIHVYFGEIILEGICGFTLHCNWWNAILFCALFIDLFTCILLKLIIKSDIVLNVLKLMLELSISLWKVEVLTLPMCTSSLVWIKIKFEPCITQEYQSLENGKKYLLCCQFFFHCGAYLRRYIV